MNNSGSGSDSDGYESDRRTPADDSPLSDWDTNDMPPTWSSPPKDDDSPLRLEVGTARSLFDSGYQKSPSVPDESPQSDKPNRLSNVLSLFDNFDKINELDAARKERKFFNFTTSNLPPQEVMRKICQEIVKHPIAGPSRDPRRKQMKKHPSSDSDDSAEEVKSITNCILENSLNKIAFQDEDFQAALIQEMIPQPVPEAPPLPAEIPEPPVVVENGDLANNNRDLEGNNYPAEDEPQVENDNDNLDNVNIDNNNEIIEPEEPPPVEDFVEEAAEDNGEADVEVAWSSREALFDVNSHVDLLEDFDMDASVEASGVSDAATTAEECPVLPPEESSFPNWLLQIFEEGEALAAEDDLHDEPHFYCQGDGLGVHPSTVALNDDEEDDDDDEANESATDSSSSRSGSVDFENAEASSSIQDVFETPEPPLPEENIVCVGHSVSASNQNTSSVASSELDVFESAEESESNLITSSCSQ